MVRVVIRGIVDHYYLMRARRVVHTMAGVIVDHYCLCSTVWGEQKEQ